MPCFVPTPELGEACDPRQLQSSCFTFPEAGGRDEAWRPADAQVTTGVAMAGTLRTMAAGSPDKPVSVDERYEELEAMAVRRFGVLAPGEQTLLRAVVEGRMADLSPGAEEPPEPETATEEQKVRARLLRWLLTDRETHALFEMSQVSLTGALIEDELDLEYANVPVVILLRKCRITEPIVLREARTRTVSLDGCHTAGIRADRVHIQGVCFLRQGFVAAGEVRLLGARIGGDLDCSRGTFRNSGGKALSMDGAVVDGAVVFTKKFTSEGEVRLVGAKIGWSLGCEGSKFSNEGGDALNAQGAHVEGAFFLRRVEIEGTVDLTSMSGRTLADEAECWPARIELSNFRYDAISCSSPRDARRRIDWLSRQLPPRDLNPQPWRHLAAVLHKQGHEADARKVMIEYWWRRTRHESPKWMQRGIIAKIFHWSALALGFVMRIIERVFALPMRVLFGAIIGHGYARWRAFAWLLVLWIVGVAIFGWNYHDPIHTPMREAQPLAMRSRIAIAEIDAQMEVSPSADRLTELEQARGEHVWVETRYPAFNPLVYSLDTLLPIVDFNQETYWTPKDGWRRSFFLPFQIAMGWVVTTLFVVSFTGLVRRGDE